MNRPWIIGVMGGGDATPKDLDNAYRLGCLVAQRKWCLLNGGRNAGIMDASARGAFENGGLTVGILPGTTLHTASAHILIPIRTGMGIARNCINVLSSDVVVACPGGAGTLSEIALALKSDKPVITMGFSLAGLPGLSIDTGRLFSADTPEAAVALIEKLLK